MTWIAHARVQITALPRHESAVPRSLALARNELPERRPWQSAERLPVAGCGVRIVLNTSSVARSTILEIPCRQQRIISASARTWIMKLCCVRTGAQPPLTWPSHGPSFSTHNSDGTEKGADLFKHSQKYIHSRVARRRHRNTQALASLLMISTGDTSIQPSVCITAREQACNKWHAKVYSDFRNRNCAQQTASSTGLH